MRECVRFYDHDAAFSWERASGPDWLSRAPCSIYLQLVHPFNDGNGRLARLFLNAKLTTGNCGWLIVPISLRVDQLACLEALTVGGNPEPFLGLLSRLIRFFGGPSLRLIGAKHGSLGKIRRVEGRSRGVMGHCGRHVVIIRSASLSVGLACVSFYLQPRLS